MEQKNLLEDTTSEEGIPEIVKLVQEQISGFGQKSAVQQKSSGEHKTVVQKKSLSGTASEELTPSEVVTSALGQKSVVEQKPAAEQKSATKEQVGAQEDEIPQSLTSEGETHRELKALRERKSQERKASLERTSQEKTVLEEGKQLIKAEELEAAGKSRMEEKAAKEMVTLKDGKVTEKKALEEEKTKEKDKVLETGKFQTEGKTAKEFIVTEKGSAVKALESEGKGIRDKTAQNGRKENEGKKAGESSEDATPDGMTTEIITTKTVTTTRTTTIVRTAAEDTGGATKRSTQETGAKVGSSSQNVTDKDSTTKSTGSAKSYITPRGFEIECLEAHNEYRRRHKVPPLKLSKFLCEYAEEWASRLASEDKLRGRQNTHYGENLYAKWSSNPSYVLTGAEVVDSWYNSGVSYVYGQEPTMLRAGQFTQIVWKESRELGIAQAKSQSGKIFVVANYDPPGNFIGSFVANVLPAE